MVGNKNFRGRAASIFRVEVGEGLGSVELEDWQLSARDEKDEGAYYVPQQKEALFSLSQISQSSGSPHFDPLTAWILLYPHPSLIRLYSENGGSVFL